MAKWIPAWLVRACFALATSVWIVAWYLGVPKAFWWALLYAASGAVYSLTDTMGRRP